ncbi:MAG: winged helix-turn-helix transcriptional regulator [Anaerolineales bacterium]|jgi:DNA-binding MarR family transcriptional regulator
MDDSVPTEYARDLLEAIEEDPDVTQASLATRLGVAVGTVNWHLKRLVAKGYVKVKRAERKKLRYIITPEGIALRAKLTVAYVENSMKLYREIRDQAREAIKQVRAAGYEQVAIEGNGDIADVCRLTCLEMNIDPNIGSSDDLPTLQVAGSEIKLSNFVFPGGEMPEEVRRSLDE